MPHGSPKAKKIRKLVEKVDNIALLQNLIATLPGIGKKKTKYVAGSILLWRLPVCYKLCSWRRLSVHPGRGR